MAYLEVLSGVNDVGRLFPLGRGTWVLGRDPGDAFQLNDPRVSRHHARLHFDDDRATYTISNDISGAELQVAGQRLSRQRDLRHGDQILIGSTVLVFMEAPLPATAKPDQQLKNLNARHRETLET